MAPHTDPNPYYAAAAAANRWTVNGLRLNIDEIPNICTVRVDAIVNAANPELSPGSGVCGAIFQAAGVTPFEECQTQHPGGIQPGQAVITRSGSLTTCRHIIHAVAPFWPGYDDKTAAEEAIFNAYTSALRLAEDYCLTSVCLPSLGTGIYECPLDIASKQAMRACCAFAKTARYVKTIQFALWKDNMGPYANAADLYFR